MSAYQSAWVTGEVSAWRSTVRRFVENEFVPRQATWCRDRRPDRAAWSAAGAAGLLLPDVSEAYGGGGGSFAHAAVVLEELAGAGIHFGSIIQSVVAHYILAYGTPEQKERWLPQLARGAAICAIAISEPGAGSDMNGIRTRAPRDGDHYVIDGSKTFVTNGCNANLICVAVRTDKTAPAMRGISLLIVECDAEAGCRAGAPLEKIGMHGQDTCELFFDGVRVPVANLLGAVEGRGLGQVIEQLPYERLGVGVTAVATAERAIAVTTQYVKDRSAFGERLIDFQNTRFKLAECMTEARIGRVFLDDCIARRIAGSLDEITTAMVKYWLTDCQCRIVDECVQLHGGYGYMTEYPIARMWADSRVQRIYAGTNEIMKELIACSM